MRMTAKVEKYGDKRYGNFIKKLQEQLDNMTEEAKDQWIPYASQALA